MAKHNKYDIIAILSLQLMCTCVQNQRPPFAGSRPIGYPELTERVTEDSGLGNRFGEGDGTTQKLPIEALGDRDLVDRISRLPIDQQPFWYLNWQALEANRKNPQTYPQRPNSFVNSNAVQNGGRNETEDRFGTSSSVNSASVSSEVDRAENRFADPNSRSSDITDNSGTIDSFTSISKPAQIVNSGGSGVFGANSSLSAPKKNTTGRQSEKKSNYAYVNRPRRSTANISN